MLENFGSKTTNIIVLDLEGFKFKSLGFIIKELSLCSNYNDTIFFKPPLKFADLPTHDTYMHIQHAYTNTYIHTYIHTYKHTYIHTYTHTYIYIHTYFHTHTYINIHIE